MTSRPSTEAQFQDENRSGCAQQWNNADLLRQQRTSDPQQSSRAIFVRFDRAAQSSPTLRLGRAESGACAPTRPHPPSREFQVVIVINGGDGKGMLVIGALERDT